MASEIKVDTVSEKTSANGVTIDGVALKDGAVTATGVVTGTAFTAGSAVLAEAELELLDGLTAGTAIASKVVTTDGSIDTSGQRNLTISGELDAATGDFSGAVDVAGTTTAVAITASGLITANADMLIGGTTPTLTIGDAGAEDAKIVFDGNAQDYHIGLDDSADDLVIGKGSALGTTAHIVTDENGNVTKPLQPVFLVIPNADQADLATGSTTAAWGAEIFDVGANFASNTFTAPVTGKYQFNVSLYLTNIDVDTTLFDVNMIASNRTQRLMAMNMAKDFSADSNAFHSMNASTILDMDASDTVTVRIDITGGGGVIHLNGTAPASEFYTNWSGALIC